MRRPAWLDAHCEARRLRAQLNDLYLDFWEMERDKDERFAALGVECDALHNLNRLLETEHTRLVGHVHDLEYQLGEANGEVVVLRGDVALMAQQCAVLLEQTPSDLRGLEL